MITVLFDKLRISLTESHSAGVVPRSQRITHLHLNPITTETTTLTSVSKMTRFRPCIDLHAGQVKQIVGGTLTTNDSDLKTNYVSKHSAAYYAELYKSTNSFGAHVIMLGPGNDGAAREALEAWPGRLQAGGGISDLNAASWIQAGAEKVSLFVVV